MFRAFFSNCNTPMHKMQQIYDNIKTVVNFVLSFPAIKPIVKYDDKHSQAQRPRTNSTLSSCKLCAFCINFQ